MEENFIINLCKIDNNILMYSTYNECNSVIAYRFIKTLEAKIYKK